MGLIIKNKIQNLLVGYPTESDKYDVEGGLLGGSNVAHYGDVLSYTATQGVYEKETTIGAVGDIAGIFIAQNVKLTTVWPGGEVKTEVGEAVNLFKRGYIAVQCATNLATDITPGAKAYVTTDGKFTTASANTFDIGAKFTGLKEGTNTAGYVAEIVIE